MRKPYTQGKIFIGRLPKGCDLVGDLTRIANEEGIRVGTVIVHGSVSRLVLANLNQETRIHETTEYDEGLEIASVSGTISQFKGRSLARLNGAFARCDGSTVGGTISLGTIVYACEVVIVEMLGGTLSRDFDMETGLPLWKENSLLAES